MRHESELSPLELSHYNFFTYSMSRAFGSLPFAIFLQLLFISRVFIVGHILHILHIFFLQKWRWYCQWTKSLFRLVVRFRLIFDKLICSGWLWKYEENELCGHIVHLPRLVALRPLECKRCTLSEKSSNIHLEMFKHSSRNVLNLDILKHSSRNLVFSNIAPEVPMTLEIL